MLRAPALFGPFKMFEPNHIVTLVTIVLICLLTSGAADEQAFREADIQISEGNVADSQNKPIPDTQVISADEKTDVVVRSLSDSWLPAASNTSATTWTVDAEVTPGTNGSYVDRTSADVKESIAALWFLLGFLLVLNFTLMHTLVLIEMDKRKNRAAYESVKTKQRRHKKRVGSKESIPHPHHKV